MNPKLRIILLALFSLIFVVSAVMLIQEGLEYKENGDVYQNAESVAGLPNLDDIVPLPPVIDDDGSGDDSTPAPPESGASSGDTGEAKPPETTAQKVGDPYIDALSQLNLEALREQNSDVIGWIYVAATKISYPIVHYTDNDYYLYRTYLGKNNKGGSIFMECLCREDMDEFNTIIYGHRMKNLSMFGSLKYYKSKSYWREHPSVYIVLEDGIHKFNIFAAYEVSTGGQAFRISFKNDVEKQAFIDDALKRSAYRTGIKPTVKDKILTLSTCSGTGGYETRWIVQAVEAEITTFSK